MKRLAFYCGLIGFMQLSYLIMAGTDAGGKMIYYVICGILGFMTFVISYGRDGDTFPVLTRPWLRVTATVAAVMLVLGILGFIMILVALINDNLKPVRMPRYWHTYRNHLN